MYVRRVTPAGAISDSFRHAGRTPGCHNSHDDTYDQSDSSPPFDYRHADQEVFHHDNSPPLLHYLHYVRTLSGIKMDSLSHPPPCFRAATAGEGSLAEESKRAWRKGQENESRPKWVQKGTSVCSTIIEAETHCSMIHNRQSRNAPQYDT